MIELSSLAMSQSAKKVNIYLPRNSDTFFQIKKKFINNKKINVNYILRIERFLLKLGFLSQNLKKTFILSDFIFAHNAELGKSLKNFSKTKPIILFFHTDKIKQIKKLEHFSKVFSVNTSMTKTINNYFNIDKAYFLPNCINFQNKKTFFIKKKENIKFTVGAMGRLVEKKGFERLIEICIKLPEINLLIGGDGPLMKKLLEKSRGYKNIKLLGWVKNKSDFYSKIDVFCSSSNIEPFGIVILEAMAMGVPVISTDCRGPMDIINNGYNGIIVKKNNFFELQKYLKKFKKDKTLLKKFSKNGVSEVQKKYTFEAYKKNLFSLLGSIER